MSADYKVTINKLLEDDHYLIPNLQNIFATTMFGGTIFTILDIEKAYLHLPIDGNSSKKPAITTLESYYRVTNSCLERRWHHLYGNDIFHKPFLICLGYVFFLMISSSKESLFNFFLLNILFI